MKNLRHWFLGLGTLFACTFISVGHAQQGNWNNAPTYNSASRMGVVSTKKCFDESKFGKQEQANFEKMKDQMESILKEKEQALEDLETKMEDDDYMDSLSDEAANDLKSKSKKIRKEGMQLQSQYMQTLQQANVKILQKLMDMINKASIQVVQESANSPQPLDIIFTDEACTYFVPQLDVSDRIISKMNALFDAEQKDTPSKPRQ